MSKECTNCLNSKDIYIQCDDLSVKRCESVTNEILLEPYLMDENCSCDLVVSVYDYDQSGYDSVDIQNNKLTFSLLDSAPLDSSFTITLKIACPCQGISDFMNVTVETCCPFCCDDDGDPFYCDEFLKQFWG